MQIVSGANHSLALSATGRCYAWGAGTHGQVASPTRQNRRLPRLIVLETLDSIRADGRVAGESAGFVPLVADRDARPPGGNEDASANNERSSASLSLSLYCCLV